MAGDGGTLTDDQRHLFTTLIVIAMADLLLYSAQQHNQVVRPLPLGPPPPVVPHLPDLIAEFSRLRTLGVPGRTPRIEGDGS